jgi:hypothetical protein
VSRQGARPYIQNVCVSNIGCCNYMKVERCEPDEACVPCFAADVLAPCLLRLPCPLRLLCRVMTDPQDLWVGPGSQAAQEKAAFEVRCPSGLARPAGFLRYSTLSGQPFLTMSNLPLTCLQASFGPFYRITQLILTTTPAANSSFTSPSGLPSIVTGAPESCPLCCGCVADRAACLLTGNIHVPLLPLLQTATSGCYLTCKMK